MTAPPETGDHQYTGQCVGGPWDGMTFSHYIQTAEVFNLMVSWSELLGTYTYDPTKALWNWSPE